MKFGKFKLGKSKNEPEYQEQTEPELTEDVIQEITSDDTPARPHAPLGELSLEPEEIADGPDYIPADEPEEPVEASEEIAPVNIVEVQYDPVPAAPQEKSNFNNDTLNESIGDIFRGVEEEEQPLANLINALPDVAASELIDDLKEINDIIKDWQKK